MRERKLLRRGLLDLTILLCFMGVLGRVYDGERAAETAAVGEKKPLPIIMYHSILKDPERAGDYVVSPATLEGDLAYLKEQGYETVVMADAIAYVNGDGMLPDKPVMLTFDDGYYNNLLYALPLLEQYDMRAVLSPVGSYTDRFTDTPDPNPNYGHLTWEELAALQTSGRFEIQNHSYDMHGLSDRRGSSRKKGESESAYARAFCDDTERMQQLLSRHGIEATTYTYPYGAISDGSGAFLREMGFAASLSCYERISVLVRGEPASLFCLGRFNRPAKYTTAEFMRHMLGD